jgi:hypothetical protein
VSSQGISDVICNIDCKTMSLLAFLLRNPNDALKSFKNAIPEYVVRLLKDCPPELSSARKVYETTSVTNICTGIIGCDATCSQYRFPWIIPCQNRYPLE